MSNPLDNKEFEHWLNFISDGTGMVQISEPVKFDAAEFVIEQDDKGYARDISKMSEEVSLEFIDGFFEKCEPYQLTDGTFVYELSHQLEKLLEYDRRFGFQSQIEYILKRNGVEFIVGELNFEGRESDNYSYFKCKVIQETKRALARRREDVEIDGFATEDLDGNAITPINTERLFLKAKPETQISEWKQPNITTFLHSFIGAGGGTVYYNQTNQVLKSGIDNTLGFFSFYTAIQADIVNSGYVDALDDLTDVIINLTFKATLKKDFGDFTNNPGSTLFIVYDIIQDIQNPLSSILDSGLLCPNSGYTISTANPEIEINLDFTKENLEIPRDARLVIYIQQSTAFLGGGQTSLRVTESEIKISAASTSIDTVVNASKYIDLAKHSLKVINGMELAAPDFDEGGLFDNLYAFSGNLIRQRTDVPFYFNFKDRKENLMLMNSDIQINNNNAFCLKYDAFYANVDNGGFAILPDESFSSSYNKRYAINLLEWSFKDYEKDRDEENTLDSVHTEAQFSINNTRVKNTKKIDIKDGFDPFRIETIRKQTFKETTALDGDDKIYGIDAVNLPPNTRSGFSSLMRHNITDEGKVQLLKNSKLPSWALLGFNVGSEFKILSDENEGTYEVFEIENTILTLTPINPPTQTFQNEAYTKVDYPLENVSLTNRTNEGFTLIENLLNPDNFSNLKYTIRRNLVHWEEYISTCTSFITDNPKNTKFVNNGELVTQFEGGETYKENADIDLSTIKPRILSPLVYSLELKVGFDEILDIISKYNVITTAGGFMRFQNQEGRMIKLYPSKLGYTWMTKKLNIEGEERKEPDVITITKVGSLIEIDEVGYERQELAEVIYEINGNYLTIYDNNMIKIINFTRYNNFVVQEETFGNINDLAQALINL